MGISDKNVSSTAYDDSSENMNSQIRILHQNICSLRNKVTELLLRY